jgi:hypothetical protein
LYANVRVRRAVFVYELHQFVIPAMTGLNITATSRPNPGLAIGRTDILLSIRLVYDEVNAFSVFQGSLPVSTPGMDDGLSIPKSCWKFSNPGKLSPA